MEKTINNLKQLVGKISTQLDSTIKEIDIISVQVVYSNDIQNILADALESSEVNSNYFDLNYQAIHKTRNILVSINSPKVISRRISIFNKEYNYASVGTVEHNGIAVKKAIKSASWIKDVLLQDGKGVIIPPHPDDWIEKESAPLVISLSRTINATFTSSRVLGIVEVQQPYSKIEEICKSDNTNSMKVIILGSKGEIIYPFGSINKDEASYYYKIANSKENKNTSIYKNPFTKTDELVYKMRSSYTGWNIVIAQSRSSFLQPIYFIQKITYAIGFMFIFFTFIVVFFITKKLTAPIRELRNSINRVSLENLSMDLITEPENNEIVQLNEAFEKMFQRLKESINQSVQARTSEMQANLLALQAQMNPHFLYNTLMGISAVAQDLHSKEIISMCAELSQMLRYISSFDNSLVTLTNELVHAENYLRLVKWRYEDKLNYEFVIDEKMKTIKIPKLVIQPIIENSFSHGFINTRPPWRINVSAYIDENQWSIKISDNGSGFSEEAQERIKLQQKQYELNIKSGKILNKLEFGGMGIINIYIRLHLIYGSKTIFRIENNDAEGSTVTIGGPIINSFEEVDVS